MAREAYYVVEVLPGPVDQWNEIPESEGTKDFAEGFLAGMEASTPAIAWRAITAKVSLKHRHVRPQTGK